MDVACQERSRPSGSTLQVKSWYLPLAGLPRLRAPNSWVPGLETLSALRCPAPGPGCCPTERGSRARVCGAPVSGPQRRAREQGAGLGIGPRLLRAPESLWGPWGWGDALLMAWQSGGEGALARVRAPSPPQGPWPPAESSLAFLRGPAP